jgi:hypothetical protein
LADFAWRAFAWRAHAWLDETSNRLEGGDMKQTFSQIDDRIRTGLKIYAESDKEYWSFRKEKTRDQINSFFQYPAMMVPQMQERLINTVVEASPYCHTLYEPFVGAGTVMLAAMKRGMDFTGQDINPLAILLCLVKRGPFFDEALREKRKEILALIKSDRRSMIEADFPNLKKWFKDDVSLELSKIRRGIRKETNLWCRRFYWVALAETVRLTSNSRTTTFKLHIKPGAEVKSVNDSPIEIFGEILRKNISRLASQKAMLTECGMLHKGQYRGKIVLKVTDSAAVGAPSTNSLPKTYDLLVTSPPYGDNKTTIPYGQHSFLPLQWIDLSDISKDLDESCISTTHEIDSRSLGGRLRGATQDRTAFDASKTLSQTVRTLQDASNKCHLRVAAFWRDLNQSLKSITKALKPNAYMIWTVGNRSVGGQTIKMDRILEELLVANGAEFVDRFKRPIPTKRMARKNNFGVTMSSEMVLILRRTARNVHVN